MAVLSVLISGIIILSLPMRNWNKYNLNSVPNKSLNVLSLPMRNWNFFFLNFFYFPVRFWVYLWGIETRKGSWSSYPYWSFESTYEELKLHLLKPVISSYYVLSLTMRNWNMHFSQNFNVNKKLFWVYLWGIETAYVQGLSPECLLFWVYLWGIETTQLRTHSNL